MGRDGAEGRTSQTRTATTAAQVSDARDVCRILPSAPGVYRFRDRKGVVIYVGRANDLRGRTLSYWGDLSDRPWLARMVPQLAAVEALVCAGAHEAAWLERNLLQRARPRWNRIPGGLELPAWLVLDLNPRKPSLRVIPAADLAGPQCAPSCRIFGPYLGLVRARQLRTGLLRVWPIDVMGTATERSRAELATLRGHRRSDPESMIRSITAALTVDHAALAELGDGLIAARDRAAAGLAFELAGQINEELRTVAWASQPQRVTRTDPQSAVVHGWCAGVALRLEIRDGRVHRWDQRLAPKPAVSTPAPLDLTDFASRNAYLAAQLLGRV